MVLAPVIGGDDRRISKYVFHGCSENGSVIMCAGV